MSNKLYGVFEIGWPSCQNRETKLAQEKTKQALKIDGVDDCGFWTRTFVEDKSTAQAIACDIRRRNSPKNTTSRAIKMGQWHNAVIVHEVIPDFGTRRAYWKLSERELEQARNSEMYKKMKNV